MALSIFLNISVSISLYDLFVILFNKLLISSKQTAIPEVFFSKIVFLKFLIAAQSSPVILSIFFFLKFGVFLYDGAPTLCAIKLIIFITSIGNSVLILFETDSISL